MRTTTHSRGRRSPRCSPQVPPRQRRRSRCSRSENFGGQRVVANDVIQNLANSGFNDRASSAIVRDGSWQLCDDAYFRGRCVTLRPGEYPSLRAIGLDNSVSSARELGGWGPPPGQANGGWGGGARAILYANSDFRGDRYVIEGNAMPNLGNTGFNDRAQSLRVERGYWIFCSDAAFQGRCRTFGPGSYPNLPAISTTGYRRAAGSRTITRTTTIRTGASSLSQSCRSSTTSPDCAASSQNRARWRSSACRRNGIGRATSPRNTCRITATGSFLSTRVTPRCSAKRAIRV